MKKLLNLALLVSFLVTVLVPRPASTCTSWHL